MTRGWLAGPLQASEVNHVITKFLPKTGGQDFSGKKHLGSLSNAEG
jgi:hypothetical protein